MGNFWAWFWHAAFWGAREVLVLMVEKGCEKECSQRPPPKVGSLLIKTYLGISSK